MKKILLIILVAFVLIQFFPIDKNNPAATPQLDFIKIKNTPQNTAVLIKNSCYDCHSNESKYPWYSNLQPVAWFLENHIEEARKELNFSTFATYEKKRQAHKLDKVVEVLEKNEMPLDSYVLGHPEAKLTAAQREELIRYFKMQAQDLRLLNNIPMEVEPSDFKIK